MKERQHLKLNVGCGFDHRQGSFVRSEECMQKQLRIGGKPYSITSDDEYLEGMGADFEPEMTRLFRSLIKPGDVVADIGGNIGLTAILFSSSAKKVHVFEPSPSTYRLLTTNLSSAGSGNVEAHNLGLGERAEQLTITFASNNRSGGFVSDKISLKDDHTTEVIQVEALDNLFPEGAERLDFIKIDVEGYEENVIRGGLAAIKRNRPIVALELNHFCLNVLHRKTVPDFFDFLRTVFPFLYAVDTNNATIADLHDPAQSYSVMHEHVIHFRFPNLVGGFDPSLAATLRQLEASAKAGSEVTSTQGFAKVVSPPKSVGTNERFSLEVDLSNQSTCAWYGYGERPVQLSYHWRDEAGNAVVYEGLRSRLTTGDLLPGQQTRVALQVVAPPSPGRLRLVVTLVQESVCWFEDRAFKADEVPVTITAGASAASSA